MITTVNYGRRQFSMSISTTAPVMATSAMDGARGRKGRIISVVDKNDAVEIMKIIRMSIRRKSSRADEK